MTPITVEELARTAAPDTTVTLITRTAVKMNKKDVETKTIPNPFGEVFKISKVRVILNANYEERVNQERAEEGKEANFVAKEMRYGNMVGNSLLENNGTLYVKTIELGRVGTSVYADANGDEVVYEDIKPFVPVKKPSATQDLENEVKVRNFKLESIIGYIQE